MTNLELRKEIDLINKGKIRSAWVNRADQKIYIGEKVVNGVPTPTYGQAVFDLTEANVQRDLLKQGKVDALESRLSPWIGEYESIAHEAYEALKSGAVITNDDFSTVNVVNVAAELQGVKIRDFVLDQAVTVVNTPNLDLNIDVFTRTTATDTVPEGATPVTMKGAVARTNFALTKDAGHVAITDEAQMKSVHDLFRAHIENAATDLARIKSAKIAVVLGGFGDTASADWAAFTTDHNTTNPVDAIGGRADAIELVNGTPNTIVSAQRAFRDFCANTFVKGVAGGSLTAGTQGARVITSVPQLQGYTWYLDNSVTATIAFVYDKSAVVLAQGPVRAAQYRDERAGVDGYIVRDWNLTKVVRSTLGAELTSVSA